jgi:hypothetical protein
MQKLISVFPLSRYILYNYREMKSTNNTRDVPTSYRYYTLVFKLSEYLFANEQRMPPQLNLISEDTKTRC